MRDSIIYISIIGLWIMEGIQFHINHILSKRIDEARKYAELLNREVQQ